jgi:redox-sensitive bicupin YhaK (pirin superfamily)
MNRQVDRIITAHHQEEGGGFIVRRPLPTRGVDQLDPFLLIDELGPVTYAPGEAIGAPDHPHRGFETVSYILEGDLEHEDSAGHKGKLVSGDVQWMTAGAGIVHSEMPSRQLQESGGRVHGFQIWVNLPSRLKMTQPRYQEVAGANIPTAQTPDGKARVRVIAGEALGVKAIIETHTPIVYQDWSLEPGAEVTVGIAPDHQVLAYVFDGAIQIEGRRIAEGQLAVLGVGNAVRLQGDSRPGRLLLLAGVPHREAVARYGPFVMNTEREIYDAIRDFQSGRMGEITRTAKVG